MPVSVDPRPPQETVPEVVNTDPLVDALRAAIHAMVAAGRIEATTQELLAALRSSDRLNRTEQQVGIALHALGLGRRRIRVGDSRIRLFDLT